MLHPARYGRLPLIAFLFLCALAPQASAEEGDLWTVDYGVAKEVAREAGKPLLLYVMDSI